jgi:hydrogenase maturation factor
MAGYSDARLLPGKLPAASLEAMLGRLQPHDARIVIGPKLGEDAAVLDMGDRYLVSTTDPITFATDRIGWYAVHVNANDVAVLGARPAWFFAVLLLPGQQATEAMAAAIFDDIDATCRALGASLCGGHTEITAGLDRPIVVGQMLGEVAKDRLVRKERLAPGDLVLLTRGAAIEGTSILAREKKDALRGRLADDAIARAEQLLFDPGISIVRAARIATEAGEVHAMHDPTEGGVVTGLYELGRASGTGLRAWGHCIHLLPETVAIARVFDIDPLALIASGALLIGACPTEAERIERALAAEGIPAAVVAEVRPAEAGMLIERADRWTELLPAPRDEIARVLSRT